MTEKEKKKINRPIVVRDDEYTFLCEWEECRHVLSTMKDFLLHIAAHIVLYSASKPQEENANCYSCKWCECGCQILGNYGDFERHVYFHAFHVKVKCFGELLLKKSNSQPCLMDSHSRNWIPELPESLQCGWEGCGIILDNPVLFYGHVNQHVEGFPDGSAIVGGCLCAWEGCDNRFKSKYKLREHIRSHTQEKVVACPTCGGLFSNRTKLFDHLKRQKETSSHCYHCSHCNKRFATERLLRDHMRHHVNHYKCPFCDMTCPAPSSLRTHIKYRHTEDKPFRCEHCVRRFKSSGDLRRHMENHSGQTVYTCQIEGCTFKSSTYWTISTHINKAHKADVRRYCCHLCQKKFTRGTLLSKHLKAKHKFKWPSGHSRFQYKLHADGLRRLQTIRYESIEVTEQILNSDNGRTVVMETDSQPSSHLGESLDSEENISIADTSTPGSQFNPCEGTSASQFNPSCVDTSASQFNPSCADTSASQFNPSCADTSASQFNLSCVDTSASQFNPSCVDTSASQFNPVCGSLSASQFNPSCVDTSASQFNPVCADTSASQFNPVCGSLSASQINSLCVDTSASQFNPVCVDTSASQFNPLCVSTPASQFKRSCDGVVDGGVSSSQFNPSCNLEMLGDVALNG